MPAAAHGSPKAPVVLPKASVLEAKNDWTCWFADSFKDARILVACIAVAVACWSVLARWQTYCISEEGLCSTSPCSCADPSQVMRALRTPEGSDCWQCLHYCPASQPIGLNSTNQSCHRGFCECADPMQERTLSAGSSIDDPCWQCTTPSPIVSLRMPEEPNTSCLVRAPRSQIVASLGGRAAKTLSQPETLMRLVMTSGNNVSENSSVSTSSCASFVRENMFLRDKKTRLCLSWSPSGHVWGLGKCEAQGSQELQLQSFVQEEDAFCIQGTAGTNTAPCVSLRSHICTAEAGLCTSAPCVCENISWIKQETVLEGGDACWSCAVSTPLYCSTEPQVCTTAECECQDPSHEKIISKTTEKPVRTCWSCHPQGSADKSGIFSRGAVTIILIGVFVCGLSGGLAMRRNGYSHAASQKGRKGGKATKTWTERITSELEEVWATLEDSAFTIGQGCEGMLELMRKCKHAAGTAVTQRVNTFGEWANARTAQVSATLKSETPAHSCQGSHPGTQEDACHAQENAPRADEAQPEAERSKGETSPPPDPPAQRSDERAETKAEAPEEHSSKASPGTAWDELGLTCESTSGSLQHARLLMMLSSALHSGTQVDKKSLAAKWLLLHHTSPAAAAGGCKPGRRARGNRGNRNREADSVAEEEEEEEEEKAAEADSAEAAEEAAENVAEIQKRRKNGRNRKTSENGRTASKTSDTEGKQTAGWDPLGLQGQEDTNKGAALEQARVIMLGTPSWCGSTRAQIRPRVLAATWLVLKHMPESSRYFGGAVSNGASSSNISGTTRSEDAETDQAENHPSHCNDSGTSLQVSSPKGAVLPESTSTIKVQRTFIEVPEPGEDDDTPLNSKLKKSVSCGDVPKVAASC